MLNFNNLERTTITGFGLARLPNYNFSTLTYLQLSKYNKNQIRTLSEQLVPNIYPNPIYPY